MVKQSQTLQEYEKGELEKERTRFSLASNSLLLNFCARTGALLARVQRVHLFCARTVASLARVQRVLGIFHGCNAPVLRERLLVLGTENQGKFRDLLPLEEILHPSYKDPNEAPDIPAQWVHILYFPFLKSRSEYK